MRAKTEHKFRFFTIITYEFHILILGLYLLIDLYVKAIKNKALN